MNPLPSAAAILADGVERGLHPGAQLAVFQHGRLVADLAFGEADPGSRRLLTPATPMPWLSAGKPVTALALAALFEDGLVEPATPVAEVIPDFAAGGKRDLTLAHLLLHTGGFRSADRLDPRLDPERTLAAICATPLEPGWIPGTTAGYHRFCSWEILAEVVHRVAGMDPAAFLQSRILGPVEVHDSWLFPPSQPRSPDRAVHHDTRSGTAVPDPMLNCPEVLGRGRPGAGFHGPARDLARLYAALLSPPSGWLRGETVRNAVQRHRQGLHDRTFQAMVDMGHGFLLNTPSMPYGYGAHAGPEAFGHSGAQTGCGFADPAHGLAVAWFCNGMPGEPAHQRRQHAVNTAIYEDLGLAATA